MSMITAAIPQQNFEVVRDRIFEILVDEIESQATLTYDPDLDASVYVEYGPPFQSSQTPCVNIMVGNGDYSNKNQGQADGGYNYYIDCFASARTTETNDGSTLAAFKLQRLMGVIRAILEDPLYKTLGIAPPSLSRTSVTELRFQEPQPQDASSMAMGRITFNVVVMEDVRLSTANLIAGYNTQVKLDTTDKGYIFSGNNIPLPEVYDEDETMQLMDIYQWD